MSVVLRRALVAAAVPAALLVAAAPAQAAAPRVTTVDLGSFAGAQTFRILGTADTGDDRIRGLLWTVSGV